jgi:hypothetical protein
MVDFFQSYNIKLDRQRETDMRSSTCFHLVQSMYHKISSFNNVLGMGVTMIFPNRRHPEKLLPGLQLSHLRIFVSDLHIIFGW